MLTLLAALLLAVPATAAACGEEAPPLITEAKATPSHLPWEGGTIRVEAKVESDCGVTVWGEITSTEGGYYPFEMLPTEETSNDNPRTYRAEFGAPANYQEWEVGYQVTISAMDVEEAFAESAYAGETTVEAAPQFDEAPYVSNATVTPLRVGSSGGRVKISADVSDNRSVNYVFAMVVFPDETQKEVALNPTSSSHFEGSFKAPANLGTSPQQYSVIVYGEDDAGQQSWESAGSFVVSPRTGLLNAWTTEGSYFGKVVLGTTATRTVVVHNNGGPKTLPVEASITTSGAPFSIRGATDGKYDFTIAPGETIGFTVDFVPTSRGFTTGSVIVSRADALQPDVTVGLSGVGVNQPTG